MIYKITHKELMNPDMQMLSRIGVELQKHNKFIAGGSIWCAYRGLPINDIDIMYKAPPMGDDKTVIRCIRDAGFSADYVTDNKGTLKKGTKFADTFNIRIDGKVFKVQVIKPIGRACGNPQDVVNNFDIRNVSLFINEHGRIQPNYSIRSDFTDVNYNNRIHLHITNPCIVLGNIVDTAHTMKRIYKYVDRGLLLDTLNNADLVYIAQAHLLRRILEQEEEPKNGMEEYESITLNSAGFTPREAKEYIQNNLGKLMESASIRPPLIVPTPTSTLVPTMDWSSLRHDSDPTMDW